MRGPPEYRFRLVHIVLRHDYDQIANEVIYQVATENLNDLEQAVRRLLASP